MRFTTVQVRSCYLIHVDNKKRRYGKFSISTLFSASKLIQLSFDLSIRCACNFMEMSLPPLLLGVAVIFMHNGYNPLVVPQHAEIHPYTVPMITLLCSHHLYYLLPMTPFYNFPPTQPLSVLPTFPLSAPCHPILEIYWYLYQ